MLRNRTDALSDDEHVSRARAGETDSYGELWHRHADAGRRLAASITSTFDPDDVVAEAFARIYHLIRAGGGPSAGFRPYLYVTIRNLTAEWGRARREVPLPEAELAEDPRFSDESILSTIDREFAARAFESLPERWREVLWYREIEGLPVGEIAPLLGIKPNAVAQLTFRAREGLREAWVQAHLASVPDESDHHWTVERLGAYSRKRLGKRDRARLEAHLDGCAKCSLVAAETAELASRLRAIMVPLLISGAGYSAFELTRPTASASAAPVVSAASAAPMVRSRPGRPDFRALLGGGTLVGGGVVGLLLFLGVNATEPSAAHPEVTEIARDATTASDSVSLVAPPATSSAPVPAAPPATSPAPVPAAPPATSSAPVPAAPPASILSPASAVVPVSTLSPAYMPASASVSAHTVWSAPASEPTTVPSPSPSPDAPAGLRPDPHPETPATPDPEQPPIEAPEADSSVPPPDPSVGPPDDPAHGGDAGEGQEDRDGPGVGGCSHPGPFAVHDVTP